MSAKDVLFNIILVIWALLMLFGIWMFAFYSLPGFADYLKHL
jgi:hypothetical protein